MEADGGVFQGLRSGTCSKEWSETGIMEPVRPTGRETGLGFQSDGGVRGRTDICEYTKFY